MESLNVFKKNRTLFEDLVKRKFIYA